MPRKKGRGRKKATTPSAIVKAVEQEAKKVAEKIAESEAKKVAKKEAKKVAKKAVKKVAKKVAKKAVKKVAKEEAKKEAKKVARRETKRFKKQLLNKWMKNIRKGRTYVYYAVPRQSGFRKSKTRDEAIQALPPGKRRSKKTGKIYYEYRKNRSDILGTRL